MNYQRAYNSLCYRGMMRDMTTTSRVKAKKVIGYYIERHRITPGSEGGKYVIGNIAWLTRKEHRIAHLILAKLRPTKANVFAAARMGTKQEWLKQLTSLSQKGKKLSEETKARMSAARLGRPSPTKGMRGKWTRERKVGKDNPFFGKSHDASTKKLMRERKTMIWTVEYTTGESKQFVGAQDIGIPESTVYYLYATKKGSKKHKIVGVKCSTQ